MLPPGTSKNGWRCSDNLTNRIDPSSADQLTRRDLQHRTTPANGSMMRELSKTWGWVKQGARSHEQSAHHSQEGEPLTLRQLVASLLTVALIAAACSSDEDSATAAVPAGDASAFCLGWPAARAALQDDLGDTNNEWEIQGDVEVARLTLDEADARVPAALRSDWTSATKFQETVITLLEIVDYTPERLPVQLVDAAFGEGGVEAAAAVSELSIERIDAWALEECGDFCELWPRLNRAFGWIGIGAGDTHESMQREGPQDIATILSADALVPDAVRDDWDAASAAKLRLVEFFTSDGLDELGDEERQQRQVEALGFPSDESTQPQVFDALVQEFGEPPPETDWAWWYASLIRDEHVGTIDAWVADNCESVGVAGLPGTIRVEDPGKSPDQLLIAAMPVGTDLGEIEDASDFLAVACSQQRPGEVWGSPLIGRTGGFDRPCIDQYREDLGARPAVLPAGTYDLFIGSFPLGVGNFNTYVPAPERCAVVSVTVDGDTEVAVPDLGPCDLGPLAGTAEEIARRQPPPDTGGPTGTLRVTLTEHLSDEGVHVFYRLAVLPAGTTLNQIALGDAWPVGAACLSVDRPLEDMLGDAPPEADQSGEMAELDEADREAVRQAEEIQQHREELERQAAELQAERQELERQQAEIDQLPPAEREEQERQLAEQQNQLDEWERQMSDELNQLEDGDRQVEEYRQQLDEQRRQTEEHAEDYLRQVTPILEAIAGAGIPVPISPYPAVPDPNEGEGCSGAHQLLLDDPGFGIAPVPVVLPAGDYDVYVFVDLWNEEMGNESQQQCQQMTVAVSGETVVTAPPLGDCP